MRAKTRPATKLNPNLPRRDCVAGAVARALLAASVPLAFLTGESAQAAKPPLPTPCVGGNCGANAQSFVQYGAAGATVNGNQMTVNQSTSKAILNWADFNIANGYSVNFIQPSATSATLNKIWSADPSVIAGALKANGQIYLYNQSGIVFDKGAQVDVGGLVASSLRLPDVLFKNGILSGNTYDGTTLSPAFEAALGVDGTTPTAGNVKVNPGATLNTAEGGRIMLLGSSVSNQGTINAPGGQVILGAGKKVYLAASTDPAMRGLLIEVAEGGEAMNAGQITSARGNVTLAGFVVNQAGTIAATTSVSENGSIYLVAGDTSSSTASDFYNSSINGFGALAPNEGGTLDVKPGSVTTITADTSSTATITQQSLDNQSFQPSQVSLVGKLVTLESGSTIVAPGGKVSAVAAGNPALALKSPGVRDNDGGRIYLAEGSTIDVSGLKDVPVAATRNLVQVTLEGNDLQDDPLLRDGLLHGLSVTVDAVRGSKLFDVTPYAGNISLGINEVLTNAGSISLISNGDVITRAGSNLNVSGGSVAYQGGYGPSTTKLLGANGKVYDISTAPPQNVEYTAVVSNYSYVDPTWGTKSQSTAQAFYPGYTQGADAGSIQVRGSQIYLRGTMTATTTPGIYQRTTASMPLGGLLQIGCQCEAFNTDGVKDLWDPAVTFANSTSDTLGSSFDPSDLTSTPPEDLQGTTLIGLRGLIPAGFSRLSIFSNGAVTLPVGTNLKLAAGGSLNVESLDSVKIAGNISAMGGTVSLTTQQADVGHGPAHDVVLAAGASIDVSGGWINDSSRLTSLPGTAPLFYDGGQVTLSAVGDTVLGAHSSIDVSGGGYINSSNTLTAGTAGKITLSAAYAVNDTSAQSGAVALGADVGLTGDSLAAGSGTLSISSGSLTIGTTSAGTPGELLLSPDFFNGRGFANYNLTGENRVVIGSTASGDDAVVIHPQQENLVFTGSSLLQPTGTDLKSFTQLQLLPASQRKAASITFTSTSTSTSSLGTPDIPDEGNIIFSQNASIVTDPGGQVSLLAKSQTGSIEVFGTITAPAGDITLQIQGPGAIDAPSGFGYVPDQEILLGSSAALSASGYATIDALNSKGYLQGKVLDGGSISLLAYRGYVVTKPGSSINVDGASGTINVPTAGDATQLIAGNAGSIAIDAREGLVLQGSLSGRAASDSQGQPIAGASGGALTVGLDLYSYFGTNQTNSSQLPNPYSLDARVLTLTDRPASALSTFEQSGVAQVSTQLLSSGGFDNVTVKSADIIAFDGPVNLSARASVTLDAPLLSASSGAAVQLGAPHVTLGYYANSANSAAFGEYFNPPAVTSTGTVNPNTLAVLNPGCSDECTGTLNVSAQEVDILGVSGWSGFKQEQLSSSGDIRLGSALSPWRTAPALHTPSGDTSNPLLRSGLSVTGDLTLTAQQVYPTTATDFTLTAASSVTIAPASGSASVPLSAGGTITINAPQITQGGTLRAPIGQIYLQAQDVTDPVTGVKTPGSVMLASGGLTSVSADGLTLPYGTTVNGQQWVYSTSSQITTVLKDGPPSKSISLNGSDVSVSKGATVDLSGGGDLYAYEWIKGPGGSKDVLGTSGVYQYALVPSLGSSFAPIDAQYAQSSPTVGANRTVYLTGVPGIANGWYALLPARYALLPGAYAVEVVKSNSDIAAGSVVKQADGSYLVTGRFGVAGTDVQSSRTSSLLIVSSATVRTQSQYTDSTANVFYTDVASTAGTVAPRLPADAGQLQLKATQKLALDGDVKFDTGQFQTGTDSAGKPIMQTGLGGQVSIQATNIVVTDSGAALPTSSVPGALQLDVSSLDALGAQTLILGANSSTTTTGEVLASPVTQSVELANTSTALTGPQIVLAARDSVVVDDNAKLATTGSISQTALPLSIQGSAAVLRVSAAGVGTLSVDSKVLQSTTGQLSIGSHASVQGSGSLLLYSSASTSVQPDATIGAPAVALYSNHVSIGDFPTGTQTSGLVLTPTLLSGLSGLTDLTIGSSSTIDLYGTVNFGAASSGSSGLHSITLDSWGLAGFGTGDKSFQAGTISLVNSNLTGSAPANSAPGTGSGSLSLVAVSQANSANSGTITLGAGTKTLSGFNSVSLQADNLLESANGTGSLNVGSASLSIRAAAVTAAGGANQTIVAGGGVSIDKPAGSATLHSADLGGSLAIQGNSIQQNGVINLPAGKLTLHATGGDVELGAGSVTAAAGASRSFSTTSAAAAGGQITLSSDTGNIGIGAGATLDLSGAASADGKSISDGGNLTISAPRGQFAFEPSATLKGGAPADAIHAGATVDVGSVIAGNNDLDSLVAFLQAGSFTGDLAIRSHTDGALSLSSSVVAHSFNLTADQGSIDVSGTINTSAQTSTSLNGGNIALWSGAGLTLEPGAQLLANAGVSGPVGLNGSKLASAGGSITLGAASGAVTINSGSAQNPTRIEMSGSGDASSDGTLTLRAPRAVAQNGVQISIPSATNLEIDTRKPVLIEGVQTYTASVLGASDSGSGCGMGGCDVADMNGQIFMQAQQFIANAATITSSLNLPSNLSVQVVPGVEIRSGGDLTLDNTTNPSGVWNLESWDAALGAPLAVTLRAQNNLVFNASLSDGFTDSGSGVLASWTFGNSVPAVGSSSYRLTAGADLSSADPLAVVAQVLPSGSGSLPTTGNLIVTPGNMIRTGTGSIDIAAGGDVLLGFTYTQGTAPALPVGATLSSVIYTAGQPAPALDPTLFLPARSTAAGTPSYPTGGGDLSVTAANDIRSVPSAQLVTDWQWRRDFLNSDGTLRGLRQNPSWWLMFNDFSQGFGVLGGGSLSLNAGGDVVNVSAVIPTTGRLAGLAVTPPDLSQLSITGGGQLTVRAGGDIAGGVFENDWGNTQITAGGGLVSGATVADELPGFDPAKLPIKADTLIYPVLLTGSGNFVVSARNGVEINFTGSSFMLPEATSNTNAVASSLAYFYGYDAAASLSIASSAGDVVLQNQINNLPIYLLQNQGGLANVYNATDYDVVYPGTVEIAALSGSIGLLHSSLNLFPSATGNLKLLAGDSITGSATGDLNSQFTLNVYESDPTSWPGLVNPAAKAAISVGLPLGLTPLHQDDNQSIYVVAGNGSISPSTMNFPKAANVIAGGDILDLFYTGKNLHTYDVTSIQAGGSITYKTPTAPTTNVLEPNNIGITVGGPGFLEVLAGGALDLGDSNGIVSSGNLNDVRLPSTGASLVVGAGFGKGADGQLRQPDYVDFINAYVAPDSKGNPGAYQASLIKYMNQLFPSDTSPTYSAALTAFNALTREQQLPFLNQVLINELSETGLAHTLQGATYDRGYTAIATLFPTKDAAGQALTYKGDIDMFFSQLKTQQGGDINVLAPGGSVVVGVPNPPAALDSIKTLPLSTGTVASAANLGMLVLGSGAIHGFADQSFEVNQSRIQTLEGGDIILWASNGNIDAGRGAKSASGAPPPVIQTTPDGNVVVNPLNDVTGSGIGQLITGPDQKPGLVNLIAPKGAVNAGDAGIRVAGNLNIAAVVVIGANNITVAGTATGVPVSDAGALSGALSGANTLGDAGKAAVDQLSQALTSGSNFQQLSDSLTPAFIVVRMFCLGVDCQAH